MSVSVYTQPREDMANEFNVANGNWQRITQFCGLSVGYYGRWDDEMLYIVRDIIQRRLDIIALRPDLDAGTPDESLRPGFTICGVPPGYYRERLTHLLRILDDAISRHVPVFFG